MEDVTRVKSLLFASCCIIWYNGKVVGTGWVAPGNKIVSAGHLFTGNNICDNIKARSVNTKQIKACFFDLPEELACYEIKATQVEYEIKFICGAYTLEPLVDFCVLQAERKIVQQPLPIASKLLLAGSFFTAGIGSELQRLSNAEGTIDGLVAQSNGTPYIKLNSQVCAQYGFSGCPIYSLKSGGVIGIQARKMNRAAEAESNTVFAYHIGAALRKVLDEPTSFQGFSTKPPLDKAMDLRDEGNYLLANGNAKEARICYKEAEKLLIQAIGKEGPYIVDIQNRIKKCSSPR